MKPRFVPGLALRVLRQITDHPFCAGCGRYPEGSDG